ncbi:MAG: carbohydrate kinase [Gammaproteobacteria bacterium]
MGKVICFGEALIDLIAGSRVPDQPPCYEQYAGGAPANVATAVARLGGDAAFVGMLAEDPFGDFLLESLKESGVDTRHAPRTRMARTALAFVSLAADGERSFSFYRSPAADQLFRVEHFDERCFDEAAVFHACSNSLTSAPLAEATFAGMLRAREAGALVSFDMNLRPALWDGGDDPSGPIHKALAMADLVKLSRSELDYLSGLQGNGDAVIEALWQGRPRLVLVTDGPGPICFYTQHARGSVPAFPVQAIDTTAAGDAFSGGFLYWLVQAFPAGVDIELLRERIEEGLRFGAACGALAVTRNGSFAAMASGEEVRQFLGAHS